MKLPKVLLPLIEASTSLAAPARPIGPRETQPYHTLGTSTEDTMKRAHWSHYDDGTYPSAQPWPVMTFRDACLWRAGLVDELPEHQHVLITLKDIANGHTISPTTNTLVPVPQRKGVFRRSNMIYTTQIARLDGK